MSKSIVKVSILFFTSDLRENIQRHMNLLTEQVSLEVTLLTCIYRVFSLNLGREIG
jgi:hypothetical protein